MCARALVACPCFCSIVNVMGVVCGSHAWLGTLLGTLWDFKYIVWLVSAGIQVVVVRRRVVFSAGFFPWTIQANVGRVCAWCKWVCGLNFVLRFSYSWKLQLHQELDRLELRASLNRRRKLRRRASTKTFLGCRSSNSSGVFSSQLWRLSTVKWLDLWFLDTSPRTAPKIAVSATKRFCRKTPLRFSLFVLQRLLYNCNGVVCSNITVGVRRNHPCVAIGHAFIQVVLLLFAGVYQLLSLLHTGHWLAPCFIFEAFNFRSSWISGKFIWVSRCSTGRPLGPRVACRCRWSSWCRWE